MTTKKRISKTESIKQILQLLRDGYATEEILEEISSNWVLPETTFYNHFKEAKKTYNNELQEQKRELRGHLTLWKNSNLWPIAGVPGFFRRKIT